MSFSRSGSPGAFTFQQRRQNRTEFRRFVDTVGTKHYMNGDLLVYYHSLSHDRDDQLIIR